MNPRLTIGIPTLGARPDRLSMAVASALGQSTPCRVAVCAQGDHAAIADAVRPYFAHPLFRLIESPASCLWENWTYSVESCDTEFFAWLQDDDVIAPHMASRVVGAFDRHAKAAVWLARLGISVVENHSNWWQGTGPMVPMDLLHGGTSEINPSLVFGGGFCTSWALSPGVAFRWSLDAVRAVRNCPKRGCDLFNERIVLAELAKLGPAICDPAVVGIWSHHEGNESRLQVTRGEAEKQLALFAAHFDALAPAFPGWQMQLASWAILVGLDNLRRWSEEAERHRGLTPTWDEAADVLRAVLDGPTTTQTEAEPKLPNAESVEAIRDAEAGKNLTRYESTAEMLGDRKPVRKRKAAV